MPKSFKGGKWPWKMAIYGLVPPPPEKKIWLELHRPIGHNYIRNECVKKLNQSVNDTEAHP